MKPALPPFVPNNGTNEDEHFASRDARCDAFFSYLMNQPKEELASSLTCIFGVLDGFEWDSDVGACIADILGPENLARP